MRIALLAFAWELPQAAGSLAAWARALDREARPDVLVLGGAGPFPLPDGLGGVTHLPGPDQLRCLDPGLNYAAAAGWAAGRYELLLLHDGPAAQVLAPSLALALEGCCLTGLTALTPLSGGALRAVRGACCSELDAVFTVDRFPAVLALGAHPSPLAAPTARRAGEALPPAPDCSEKWLRGLSFLPPAEERGLVQAGTVLVAGRGADSPAILEKLALLARRLGGCVGATRPVVYAGSAPLSSLVGVSAAMLSPRLCLVFGASGSAAFAAGVERSGLLAGINTDPAAPLFDYCDLAVVEDCGALLDALLMLTQTERSAE